MTRPKVNVSAQTEQSWRESGNRLYAKKGKEWYAQLGRKSAAKRAEKRIARNLKPVEGEVKLPKFV